MLRGRQPVPWARRTTFLVVVDSKAVRIVVVRWGAVDEGRRGERIVVRRSMSGPWVGLWMPVRGREKVVERRSRWERCAW